MFAAKSGAAQCPVSYGFILYRPLTPVCSIAFPEPISEISNAGKTKEHIFFKKRKRTIISSARGTQTKYLEKAEEIIPKPKQAYITINRGTKRVLIDIN